MYVLMSIKSKTKTSHTDYWLKEFSPKSKTSRQTLTSDHLRHSIIAGNMHQLTFQDNRSLRNLQNQTGKKFRCMS